MKKIKIENGYIIENKYGEIVISGCLVCGCELNYMEGLLVYKIENEMSVGMCCEDCVDKLNKNKYYVNE